MDIDRIKALVADHYVLPELVPRIRTALDGVAVDHADPATAAATLTDTLYDASGDRHLVVRHHPGGGPPAVHEEGIAAHWSERATATAGGIAAVRRLDDRVGLLALGPVLPPALAAATYVDAAFALLCGVDRLVIDLRECVGGVPETVALICSHFTGREQVHLLDMVDRAGCRTQSWTITSVSNAVPPTVAVRVLTSPRTFSGGEELAYHLQALGRAHVVGEQTGGGAHPRVAFELSETLQLHVPVARPIHAVTGTNWEGIGITPDMPCAEAEALDTALSC